MNIPIVKSEDESENKSKINSESKQKKPRGRPKTKTEEEKKEVKKEYMKKYNTNPIRKDKVKELNRKHYELHPEVYKKQGYIMTSKYKESYKIIKELQNILKLELNDTNDRIITKDLKLKIIAI